LPLSYDASNVEPCGRKFTILEALVAENWSELGKTLSIICESRILRNTKNLCQVRVLDFRRSGHFSGVVSSMYICFWR